MMLQFSLNDDDEMFEWDNYVLSHSEGTPFHLSYWLKTIYETYKFEPLLFVQKDRNNQITGLIPSFYIKSFLIGNRIVSIPFSDYGGPLFDDCEKINDSLGMLIEKFKNKVKYFEFRSSLPKNNGNNCYNYYKRHILELSKDPADVKKKINKRTIQYSIRKAIKSGVEIEENNTIDGIMNFFRLNSLTRKKHGVPRQPKKYFINLFENMVKKDIAYAIFANINAKIVAGSIFFKFNNTIHYKYNASDPEYLKSYKPNHLLTWYAIEKACIDGFQYLDFGRTSPDNKGLMRYKKMWGAEPIDCHYNYYPEVMGVTSMQEDGFLYKLLTRSWKLLPSFIDSQISYRIYKHMG